MSTPWAWPGSVGSWSWAGAEGTPLTVEGPAVLAGFGSAAPSTEESYRDDVHTTSDGRALAVVRPTGPGTITVRAAAPGCDAATVTVVAR